MEIWRYSPIFCKISHTFYQKGDLIKYVNLFQQLGPIVDRLGIKINNIQNSNNVKKLTDIMINGHPESQYQDNIYLFSVVQKYIGNTKWF